MGKKASNFVDAFRHSYPDDDVDALYRLDTMVRPAAIEQIQTRVADGGAPVWNYLFSYQLPSEDSGFHDWKFVSPNLKEAIKQADSNFDDLWISNGNRHLYGLLSRPTNTFGKMPLVIVSHGFNGTHELALSGGCKRWCRKIWT